MGPSVRFTGTLSNVYYNREVQHYTEMLHAHLSHYKNNIFNKSLVVDISGDEFEIPVIAMEQIETAIIGNGKFNNQYVNKIIISLYDNEMPQVRKTFDTIITQFFRLKFSSRLLKITTTKGEVYYGGKGIILDGDFNPLLLCTLSAKKVKNEDKELLTYYKPVCHINPKVFMETDKLINKGIIKKLIPFYSNSIIYFPYKRTNCTDHLNHTKAKVVIDDFSHFFSEPVKPSPSTCSNELLNQCLVDNIEDIMMLV